MIENHIMRVERCTSRVLRYTPLTFLIAYASRIYIKFGIVEMPLAEVIIHVCIKIACSVSYGEQWHRSLQGESVLSAI